LKGLYKLNSPHLLRAAWLGVVWQARLGKAWRGTAWLGLAWLSSKIKPLIQKFFIGGIK